MPANPPSLPPPVDAATVLVVRDGSAGIETLLLKKNSRIHFGGMWVFPGGRVDAEDVRQGTRRLDAFRLAAAREAREEAGITLAVDSLIHTSHWLPPPIRPKRFSTHFFVAPAPEDMGQICVDGAEITDHIWITAATALRRRHAREIEMVTPTFVTLDWLRDFESVAALLAGIGEPVCYHTRIVRTQGGSIAFYEGDAAYESLDPAVPGPRRRANMLESGWWWEEHDGYGNGPRPAPLDFV